MKVCEHDRRRRRGFIGVALLSLLAAICSHAAAQQVTVTLIGPFGQWGEELGEALRLFSQHATGVTAELIVASNWNTTMAQAAVRTAGGVAPDLLYGSATPFFYYAYNSLSQPVDFWVERDIDLRRYPDPVVQSLYLGDRIYGLPTAVSPSYTYYNTDRFAEAGLDMLPVRWDAMGFDWDDFVTICRKLTREEGGLSGHFGIQAFGRGGGWNRLGMWGINLFDPAMTEFYGNQPAAIEAMDLFATLWTKHGVVGGSLTKGTASMTLAHADTLNSLIALQQSGSSLNWSVGVLPKGVKRPTYTAFNGIGLSSQTGHPESAWQLLKFLAYDADGAVLFSRAENRIPVIPSTTRDFVQRYSRLLSKEVISAFSESPIFAYDAYVSRHPKGAQLLDLLDRELKRPSLGQVSARQAMAEVEPVVRALLKER